MAKYSLNLIRFLVWWHGLGYAIAISTGRNPDECRQIKQDLIYWERQLDKAEVAHV
jgi:hypothetical protein